MWMTSVPSSQPAAIKLLPSYFCRAMISSATVVGMFNPRLACQSQLLTSTICTRRRSSCTITNRTYTVLTVPANLSLQHSSVPEVIHKKLKKGGGLPLPPILTIQKLDRSVSPIPHKPERRRSRKPLRPLRQALLFRW